MKMEKKMLSNPLNFSCCEDPAVEVAEYEAHKEALERQECGFNHVEHLRNQNRFDSRQIKKSDGINFSALVDIGKTCIR